MSAPLGLDVRSFPLHGSRLIEASAGTGKTWTIASLYLRLVLGQGATGGVEGEPTGFQRALAPAEILVMTFTRAATRELSERIRARLIEAAACFRGVGLEKPADSFLEALKDDYPEGVAREQAAWRLATAAEAMDDSAVMTIDAWCQRMLNEHAFDTSSPFDETLLAQEDPLREEAIRDYWRQHCYPLRNEALETVCAVWEDAEALAGLVRPLLKRTLNWSADPRSLQDCASQWIAAERDKLAQLSEGWVERAQMMRDWCEAEVAPKSKPWNRKKLSPNRFGQWTEQLAKWAKYPVSKSIGLTDTAMKRLTPDGLYEVYDNDPSTLRLPPMFAEFALLAESLSAMKDPGSALLAHAAGRIAERLQALKQQRRSFSFADMTVRLEHALSGPNGDRLRGRMLARHPAALIDEFQDTSPEQYRLFDSLYRCQNNDKNALIVLIGDPKQSIYGFRGADIHSYLKARAACADRIHALDTNHRSTQEMVEAVNAWFEQAEVRTDPQALEQGTDGAFRFRRAVGNPMPFFCVRAAGRAERFRDSNGSVPALTLQHDLRLSNAKMSRTAFAARCAERIVNWLNDEQAGFDVRDNGFKRLHPSDIAVLVRDRHEAAAIRHALRARGVSSIFQSEQDSVFASPEAGDLLRWLRAVGSPGDMFLVRAALATGTLDLAFEELLVLASDDDAYDRAAAQMRALQAVWKERGVLAMLRRSLHEFRCPSRWLSTADGERRLTNLLHLAELLQQASVEAEGEQALIQWLASRIDQSGETPGEEQVLRLESDAGLVQVITIHKSKGLQYPVVCLPFACSYRPIDKESKPGFVSWVDASGERKLSLEFGESELEQADEERLREELRLFYVALTRAQHAVWMGFASLKRRQSKQCQTRHSAPGRLLAGSRPIGEGEWLEALEVLADRANGAARLEGDGAVADGAVSRSAVLRFALEGAPERSALTRLVRQGGESPLATAEVYRAEFERGWAPGSYSLLTRDIEGYAIARVHARRPAEDEDEDQALEPLPAPAIAARRIHPVTTAWQRFPGGARGGDFVHGVLEWLAAEQFELTGKPWLEDALRERCQRAGYLGHEQDLVDWMRALLETNLPSLDASLPQLRSRVTEMEFWMPAASLHSTEVDRICRAHLLDACERPVLPPRTLKGMLMGFADLVFEHQGRFWVLDYKSNRPWAEPTDRAVSHVPAYDRSTLQAEMARHRYDVQAAVYLLALHRQLRARLGSAYDPRVQLGGAIYWFIRGIDEPIRGEFAIAADAGVIELVEQLDRMLGLEFEVSE